MDLHQGEIAIHTSITPTVKDQARRLGFTLAGITTPDPPPHLSAYENWLRLGRHASMAYLAEERTLARRADPRRIMPECRSILVLGVRYPDPHAVPTAGRPSSTGRIAAYAGGRDYHLVLPQRLTALARFIQNLAGSTSRTLWYTDTGPLLERELAQRAGLGWIGKNTCLIAPHAGSYFLLAEILLAIELEPDPPFTADRCGTCRRCIEACPTRCILPDRTLDARRCISYLTIENRGEIPADLLARMGDRVFGCDICQEVCPWNRFSAPEYDRDLAPFASLARPDLAADLKLTQQEFDRKFKDSPVRRARRSGYLRNLAIALGNSGDPAVLPALEQAQQDDEPLVRQYAGWALDRIRNA